MSDISTAYLLLSKSQSMRVLQAPVLIVLECGCVNSMTNFLLEQRDVRVRGLAAPCGTDQGTGVKTTDSNRLHSIV